MKGSDGLLYMSLILVAAGVGGFIYYTGAHGRSLVVEEEGFDYSIEAGLRVSRGHSYEIRLSVEDTGGMPWNKVDAEAGVYFNGDPVYEESFTVTEFPGKKAETGFVFSTRVKANGFLTVEGCMRTGCRWTLSIYRDLPPMMDIGALVSAIIGLLGFIGFVQVNEAL